MDLRNPKVLRHGGFDWKGERVGGEELELIVEIVREYPNLARTELGGTVAELLGWERPSGDPKTREAYDLLLELDAQGIVELPAPNPGPKRGATTIPQTEAGEPQQEICACLGDLQPITLVPARSQSERALWRELIGRYHYLGYKPAFGAQLRWTIEGTSPGEGVSPERQILGCLQVSSPAWKMAPRDEWIGWDQATRKRNLQQVVNNSRFLLLPWVRVRNLASHVLALLAHEMPAQWEARYGVRPLLLETLVDAARFRGTCYAAANWLHLGSTTGRGRMDRHKQRIGAEVKQIFVLPLHRRARRWLRQA